MEQFITFNFDFKLVQTKLAQQLQNLQTQIDLVNAKTQSLEKGLSTHVDQLNEKIAVVDEKIQNMDGLYEQKFNNLNGSKPEEKHGQLTTLTMEKTPTQVLNDMEKRVKTPRHSRQVKQLQIIDEGANSQRVCYTVRIKSEDDEKSLHEEKQKKEEILNDNQIDKKCLDIYAKMMEVMENEITKARNELKDQLSEWKNENGKIINEIANSRNGSTNIIKEKSQEKIKPQEKQTPIPSLKQVKSQKSERKPQTLPSKKTIIQPTDTPQRSEKKQKTTKQEQPQHQPVQQTKMPESIEVNHELRNKFIEIDLKMKNNEQKIASLTNQLQKKIEQNSKSNLLTIDHVVQMKKEIQQLNNVTDTLKMEASGLSEKTYGLDRQVSLVVECSNDLKNKFRQHDSQIADIVQEMKIKFNELDTMKETIPNSDERKKEDSFRQSRESFRSSMMTGLGPLRPQSIVKQNNNKLQMMEEGMKKLSAKVASCIDRMNKMEDEKKKFDSFQSSLLPKIDKENKSNVNHFQIIRKDIKRINEDLVKTNDKLARTKESLNDLYSAHAEIPTKIQDLYVKLREYNQIQEDRLIDLIKQLINRMLTDPFDNNFTNTLKRQINVKFLQIKHEYNSILKEIGNKLDGRAQQTEMLKIKEQFEQNIIQVKAILNKKCQTEDFKKGIKYLEGKIKDVFQFTKNETTNLYNEQKKYIGVRKQA